MNLDIDALRTFVAIAETKSFTAAAGMVSRTQSTVSMQIKKLEERLGFALFERSRRSLTISPRGIELLGYAKDILKLNDDGVRAVTAPRVNGRVKLGITEYFVPEHLAHLLADFRRVYPDVEIEFTTGLTGGLLARQKLGELDMVIGRRDVGSKEGTFMRKERVHWVASADYKVKRSAPLELVLLPVGCGIRALATGALDKQRRQWRASYCGPSVLGLQAAVSAGVGIGCLTNSAIKSEFKILSSREKLPALPMSEIALFMPRGNKRERIPSAAHRELNALAEAIKAHFASGATRAMLA
jgi:DNA-binding transcriptional LysR family regulator